MWTAIGIIVSAVVGPLVAWFIKKWWSDQVKKEEERKRLADEAAKAAANDQAVGQHTGEVNHSIDEQRKAREQWAKDHPV